MNLTNYHKLFLKHLCAIGTRFLIIGGQARTHYIGGATKDLDLWLPIDNSPNSLVHKSLIDWSSRYSNHTALPIIHGLKLTERTQVSFPTATIQFLNEDNQVETVKVDERIDILFWFEGLAFDLAYQSSCSLRLNQLNLQVISKEHLEAIKKR